MSRCLLFQQVKVNYVSGMLVFEFDSLFVGGEADIIILSTVRSLPRDLIVEDPTRSWISDHLGFVTDPHQINVALTRAKHGLFILGKRLY